jgi:DNA (cytosine-5)-methyltransferase 1
VALLGSSYREEERDASMRHINQLDLFSGIGGFHLGFEKAGYKVTSFFSEIDKHAIAVYKHQFKDSTYVGSVTDVRGADLPSIDLITFGSPCQDFSLAGKRAGMEGQRSSLILEAIRLIHECRPRVFVWENVKGTFSSNNGADFWAIIQAFANIGGYRLEWQLLNTSWVLPQNRERIYLVGYSTAPAGDWGGVFPITEASGKSNGRPTEIAAALQHPGHSGGNYRGMNMVAVKQIGTRLDSGGKQPYQQDRVYDADGEAPALNAGKSDLIVKVGTWRTHKDGEGFREVQSGDCPTIPARAREDGSGQPVIKIKTANQQGYQEAEAGDAVRLYQPGSETQRGRVGKGIAHTLETTGQQGVVQPNYTYEKVNETIRRNEFKEGEVKAMDLYNKTLRDESPTLTQPEHNGVSLFDGYRIRRLTPIECERLQGFPDDHTAFGLYDDEVKPMSNTQRYKQCGNAVTVDIVSLVAEQLKPIFDA